MKLKKDDKIITTFNQKVIPDLLAQGYVTIDEEKKSDDFEIKKKRL